MESNWIVFVGGYIMLDNLKDGENWYCKVCLIARQFSELGNI